MPTRASIPRAITTMPTHPGSSLFSGEPLIFPPPFVGKSLLSFGKHLAARSTNDEFGWNLHVARSEPLARLDGLDSLPQHLHGEIANLVKWVGDCGEGRVKKCGEGKVITADHRHLLRNTYPFMPQTGQRTECRHIVEAEEGVGSLGQL